LKTEQWKENKVRFTSRGNSSLLRASPSLYRSIHAGNHHPATFCQRQPPGKGSGGCIEGNCLRVTEAKRHIDAQSIPESTFCRLQSFTQSLGLLRKLEERSRNPPLERFQSIRSRTDGFNFRYQSLFLFPFGLGSLEGLFQILDCLVDTRFNFFPCLSPWPLEFL
jgi:hypothetical protein